MLDWFHQFLVDKPLVRLLDIAIVWYIIYRVLLYARNTRAMNLLKGVGIILAAKFIASVVGLQTIDWLLQQVISWGVVAVVILFQPELRRALESIGRTVSSRSRKGLEHDPTARLIQDLDKSIWYMSRRKIGALISIERENSLNEYIQTGIPMDSAISHQLLVNIFIPNTPLHDGAVIIAGHRVAAAACYLPLSVSQAIPNELGTRHRAAIGLSEVTDAVTLIVSEETGGVSLAMRDHLHRDVDPKELKELLKRYLSRDDQGDNAESSRNRLVNDLLSFFNKQKGGAA